MNLKEAERLAWKLMSQHNLVYEGWDFQFDRAKKRFGQCNYTLKLIKLSAPLTEINSEEEVRDTILHEIAHAIAGYHAGHGYAWQQVCKRIGCKPERCYESTQVNIPEGKYQHKCKGCGRIVHYHRRPKKVKACAECCRKHNYNRFSYDYLLEPLY
jgi:predicted SprT family Zn-dependent metalloprotease